MSWLAVHGWNVRCDRFHLSLRLGIRFSFITSSVHRHCTGVGSIPAGGPYS